MRLLRFLLYMAFFGTAACTQNPREVTQGEVVTLYTNCYLPADNTLFRTFEQSTGIKVNVIAHRAETLFVRLRQQQAPQADLLILKGIHHLHEAQQQQLWQKTEAPLPDDTFPVGKPSEWHSLTYDPVGWAYQQDTTTLPNTYADLAAPFWQSQAVLADTPGLLPALTACMLAAYGTDTTSAWLAQLAPSGRELPDTAQHALNLLSTADSVRLVLINAQAFALDTQSAKARIAFPNQESTGAYALVTGIGVASEAPQPAYARRLLSYLCTSQGLSTYADNHQEYPATGVPASVPSWRRVNIDKITILNSLQYVALAQRLLRPYTGSPSSL